MDYIIFDTNIFYKENFLEGKRINEFFKLSEEDHLRIVLTRITVAEVKSNYKKLTKTALEYFGQFKNKHESRTLRNNKIGPQLFIKPKIDDLTNEFNDRFDAILISSKVEIIEYSELNIKEVFDKYFSGDYPFKKSDKKSEFPDAFTLALIQKWSSEKGIPCTIFSKDTDFLKYKSTNPLLSIDEDYEKYLDKRLKEIVLKKSRIDILKKLFLSNSASIDQTVIKWYVENLDDTSLYYSFIYYEIHDIEEPEVFVNDKTYQIVSIEDESIDIEIEMDISYGVTLVIDDEESMCNTP